MNAFRLHDVIDRMVFGLHALRSRVPTVLHNPRAFPRDAMILASILALSVLLLGLAAMVVWTAVESLARQRQLRVRRRHSGLLRWVGMALGLCVVGVSVAVALTYSVPVSRACTTCHAESASVQAWASGVHHQVSCAGCHAPAGAFGPAEWTVRRSADIVGSAIHEAGVGSSRCRACHRDVAETTREVHGVRVSHREPLAAGVGCTACHSDAGHESSSTIQASAENGVAPTRGRRMMDRCVVCHDGARAPAGCSYCHDANPSDVVRIDSAGLPRAGIDVTCEGCHSAKTAASCVRCHGLVLPHPPEFFGQHARLSNENPSLCARCHTAAATVTPCGCHSEPNEHGTYSQWFPRHAAYARTNWPGGCRCHNDSFCLMCHMSLPAARGGLR